MFLAVKTLLCFAGARKRVKNTLRMLSGSCAMVEVWKKGMALSFDKICRVCLGETADLLSIYSRYCITSISLENSTATEETPTILEMLSSLVTINKNLNLPSNVCVGCVHELSRAFCFKEKCEKNEIALVACLNEATEEKKDNVLKQELHEPQTLEELSDYLKIEPTVYDASKAASEVNEAEETNDVKESCILEEEQSFSSVKEPQVAGSSVDIKSEFSCSKCGSYFARRKSLMRHQKTNKCLEISFRCNICNRVFVRKRNLVQHMGTHSTKDKPFKCPDCPKLFSVEEQLTAHASTHRGLKKHQCRECGKCFNMISSLKDHLRIHSGERPFLCSICGKGFSQSTNLKQHTMRHNKMKPYKCDTCGKTFVSKGELDAHMRKHSGEHPFVCDTCGSGFTTSSSLVKHKRIHTGERPYACDFCPMRFTALGTLKNHRRTHTGERPYECKFCERSFAQKSDMVSHTRTHTGERPYVCRVCGTAFLQSSTLKTHMKTHQNAQQNLPSNSSVSVASSV
ncbi:zinc finger protein OZF-like [Phlebotomus argentipes]|uniref:zinc finger protein OZF-like n=1 Tax=Phlebotomus argentipes TaxID=94469 RepID=UPI00289360B0|nr:zinc finger protein OZF-like [Phlebotomus argentipes]